MPKQRRTFCKGKCKKHTLHKVTQYKKGKDSLYAQGKPPPNLSRTSELSLMTISSPYTFVKVPVAELSAPRNWGCASQAESKAVQAMARVDSTSTWEHAGNLATRTRISVKEEVLADAIKNAICFGFPLSNGYRRIC